MCERTNVIKENYNNLEYHIEKNDKKIALMVLSALTKELKEDYMYIMKKDNTSINVSRRLSQAIQIIKKNFYLLESACGHVDVVRSIIQYLHYLRVKFHYCNTSDTYETFLYHELGMMINTLIYICSQREVQHFLIAVIGADLLEKTCGAIENTLPLHINIEMILLEDSDLYAVINHLMLIEEMCFINIWVRRPILKEFTLLLNKYIKHTNLYIHIFGLKQELIIPSKPNYLNVLCIWSEDIITAKSLARSSTHQVVFINTCLDVYSSTIIMTNNKYSTEFPFVLSYERDTIESANIKPDETYPTYNLFYNGMWHKSVQNEYWTYNYCKCADATEEDFARCIESAKTGFEIWRTWSTDSRKVVLSKFASVLECNGKFELSKVVSKWLNITCYDQNKVFYDQTERLEVVTVTEPKGIIYILENDEIFLFELLTQSLIIGNSVIVITTVLYDLNSYNLLPYCDMFSTSGIPPGVVNVMSSTRLKETTENLWYKNRKDIYLSLNKLRMIVLPLQ